MSKNAPASMPNTIANVPFIAFVKYNTATTATNRMRIILSAEPVFFSYFIDLIIYKFIYILPSAAIRYIGKAVLFQNSFGLAASVAASAKNNDVFFVFEFG